MGRDFLRLLDTTFPPTNPLHKLFTRQTVKISYKCMPNMAHAVSRHNSKILIYEQPLQVQPPRCKCLDCPMQGKCQTNCIVYGATIKETASGQTETYTGMTCRKFKERWREHEGNTRNQSQRRSTKLSVHA